MIRPSSFRYNHETAKNNYFQNQNFNLNNDIVTTEFKCVLLGDGGVGKTTLINR